MREFALIFRMDITAKNVQPGSTEMESYMNDWMNWISSISDNGQLADGGNHFSYTDGAVLKPKHNRSAGPYRVNKESVAGYIIVLANNLEGAISIAERCPILEGEGTSVEVRAIAAP